MKIRYFSDLHLEFMTPKNLQNFMKKIPKSNDICVLAGDIGNPHHSNNHYQDFMKMISNNFKKSFVIAGNHEYYHKTITIKETNNYLEKYFQEFDNISFLNNSIEYYENHCFVGTTLWSKITKPEYEINDVFCIPEFDYLKYNRLNMLSVDFLEDALEKNDNCVVITHHLPSQLLIDVKYKTPKLRPYNQWFYCDLDSLIEKNKIKVWIYGHTHTSSSIIFHKKPFVCNPLGYPNENSEYDFEKYIEI